MNLYLVVLGGKIPGGHVEMHDVRWVVGETIQSTVPQLQAQWLGHSRGLHIDSYKLIKFVDGHRIKMVVNDQANNKEINKLWFINLGGYKPGEMLEQHHLELVVAPSVQTAKQKARNKWSERIDQIHKDDHAEIVYLQGYNVELERDNQDRDDGMSPDWSGYWVIS